MLDYIIVSFIILTLGIFLIPKNCQYYITSAIFITLIIVTTKVAIENFIVYSGNTTLEIQYFGNNITLTVDYLSSFFILIINFTVVTGLLYAKGYLNPYIQNKTKIELAMHYFNFILLYLSMICVVIIREGFGFLFYWELMSVSTFFLILFESEKKEVKNAAMKFLIQMHIALFFLITAFMISGLSTGEIIGFDSLNSYFKNNSNFPLFLLFFTGFGIKSGFIPLHTWLPYAHPAAPSHISGIMSGVMLKMGIYGILRVVTYLHNDLFPIGLFILAISIFSGIVGVIIAIAQHDIKRLLAYHSIENIGIIGIGIGVGLIGLSTNNFILASFGFAGGLLHILNHSLFKSLLFYSSGSIYQQTHTRNIDLTLLG
ncbi:MAG: proton-conducting transporter membrane subunit [Candidatus Kapaibacteriota bacterium]